MKALPTLSVALLALLLVGCNQTSNTISTPEVTTKKIVAEKPVENKSFAAYTDYSESEFDTLRGNERFVAFFYADWCPTCRNWEKKLMDKKDQLPENAKILKVNYDEETQLAKDLHIKKQSTAVLFNSKGEIVDAIMDPSIDDISKFFTMDENDIFSATGKIYQDYSADKVSGKTILFFHADWCSTCRKWEKTLQTNIETVSPNANILKVNYDQENDLRKQYGITKQSQAVFLNADGSVAKTEGDPSIKSINAFFAETVEVGTTNTTELELEVATEVPALYATYSAEAVKGQKSIVFFHADWCGTCKNWDKKVNENLSTLPGGTQIFKADYDSDLELRKQYGITAQSQAVFLDAEGNIVKKEGDPSLESIKAFFNEA